MDIKFMEMALELARNSANADEVPVGAVVVKDGQVVATSENRKERDNCAIHHAEILAMQKAAEVVKNWWLEDCELYVTLEPCPMCVGAMIMSRIKAVYFGAYDKKTGACGSLIDLTKKDLFNHNLIVEGGIMHQECSKVVSDFFKNKRDEKKKQI